MRIEDNYETQYKGEVVENKGQELSILLTDADKYGTDIIAMSNFFDASIQQLTYELSTNIVDGMLPSIPVADLGIISDVLNNAEMRIAGEYSYVPDFDSLPRDIVHKLKKGDFTIGESKQVDGNFRAVIMDENNVRAKDITLKQVKNDSGTLETTRSLANQVQMRQIYAKLDQIQELQSYQIDRDRDRDIIVPFLNARDYILRAQLGGSIEEKRENLKKATDELTTATNAIYTDMSTSSKHLSKLTSWPIFQRRNLIKQYIDFLTLDLQLVTKYVGVQVRIFDYLGDKTSSKLALETYQHILQNFLTKGINRKNMPIARLIHLNFLYNDKNRNWWHNFTTEMTPKLQTGFNTGDGKPVYIVSVEDVDNEIK